MSKNQPQPKRALTRTTPYIYHYVDGKHVDGPPPGVTGLLTRVTGNLTSVSGNITGVSGDLSNVYGDLSNVYGDLTNVRGDLTGVCGDLTNVRGSLGDCNLTSEMRTKGINIEDLIR